MSYNRIYQTNSVRSSVYGMGFFSPNSPRAPLYTHQNWFRAVRSTPRTEQRGRWWGLFHLGNWNACVNGMFVIVWHWVPLFGFINGYYFLLSRYLVFPFCVKTTKMLSWSLTFPFKHILNSTCYQEEKDMNIPNCGDSLSIQNSQQKCPSLKWWERSCNIWDMSYNSIPESHHQ